MPESQGVGYDLRSAMLSLLIKIDFQSLETYS